MPLLRGQVRSKLSKKIWGRRKREGGKAICAWDGKPIYTGGVLYKGRAYHKSHLGFAMRGFTPEQLANPRARTAWRYYGAIPMNPRPPAGWWARMYPSVRASYPGASAERATRITAGVWWRLPESTRKRLIKRYD